MILTAALIAPNLAPIPKQNSTNPLPDHPLSHYALEAPRTAAITLEYYTEKSAQESGLDPQKFAALIECESHWKPEARGDNGMSIGILQFKRATFDLFSKKYGLAEPDINNSFQQIDLAALMIRDGYIGHWGNCARKLGWSSR